MFKDFNTSNSASWGHLAGLSKEEFESILLSKNSKNAIKLTSKRKLYKVTPIRSYVFEQEGESFIISAESESMAHYMAEKRIAEYPQGRPDFNVAIPRVSARFKIMKT